MNGKKALAICIALACLVAAGGKGVFAAADSENGMSYRIGHQENLNRQAQYKTIGGFAGDEERHAYFKTNDIGGEGPYKSARHFDVESLLKAGVIDKTTADAIAAYASRKHDDIHARYQTMSGMTMDGRQAVYKSAKDDGFPGDSMEELVKAGVLTQIQADAINGMK